MLKTYISLLRGINVSGSKIIKMDELKKLYAGLGFTKIESYKQSGNVVFDFKKAEIRKLEKKISDAVFGQFGFEVPVVLIDAEELRQIIQKNPFSENKSKDTSFLHVTFLSDKPGQQYINKIGETSFHPDEYFLKDKTVYLYLPGGYGNTKLSNNFFESRLKVKATTRNWKTLNGLLSLTDKSKVK